jgi:hypothetical protein
MDCHRGLLKAIKCSLYRIAASLPAPFRWLFPLDIEWSLLIQHMVDYSDGDMALYPF